MSDTMETISKETHEALLEKAVKDAVAALEGERADLTANVETLTEASTTKDAEIAKLTSENDTLNGKIDELQVELNASKEETAALKADIASKEEEAAKAEIAEARAAQARELHLFTEEQITEKAARWAELDDVAWDEKVEELKAVRANSAPQTSDTASAFTGTSGSGTTGTGANTLRRQVLGL